MTDSQTDRQTDTQTQSRSTRDASKASCADTKLSVERVCIMCVRVFLQAVSRVLRASKLPSYSAGGSSTGSVARTQSADRRPPPLATAADRPTQQLQHADRATDTPDRSTPAPAARRTSQLRPPTTVVPPRLHDSRPAAAAAARRPQSADGCTLLLLHASTSLAQTGSAVTSSVTSRSDAAAASSPRAGVQRRRPRDQAVT